MSNSDDASYLLILELDGLPVGEMNYRDKGLFVAEIGIKICASGKQEKGFGTLFLKMLIAHLFSNGNEKIHLDTIVTNTRAQHVYKR